MDVSEVEGGRSNPEPTRHCAYCHRQKAWTYSGKKLKDGSRVYVDSKGGRWSGRRCPQCERSRVSAAVRCDSFERMIIARQFEKAGFLVKSKSLPMQVEKDGKCYRVGIKRAYADQGKVVIETPPEEGSDIFALVFESVRICSKEQLERLNPQVNFNQPSNAESLTL
jgi:hypothetical protein